MKKPKIGLLPLYLELYDQALPDARKRIDAFYSEITSALEDKGLQVATSPICRLKEEFAQAVRTFEDANIDCIVTLHLAYSPSLESADVLAETNLPIVVLDTTPTFDYSPSQDPDELMYNHGIHGVQDMCNLLIRKGKDFLIEAGHWQESDVLDRVAQCARAACAAAAMRSARIGLIGEPFKGMGDFGVPFDVLKKTIGIEVVKADQAEIAPLLPSPDEQDICDEISADLARFKANEVDENAHKRTARAGLAIRRWIEKEALTGFTMNFLAFDKSTGIDTVPFLEADKSMARGIGYAGEGDVLTAALVGALAAVYPSTTFTEMFCPDWKNNSIYVSHMGEVNINLAGDMTLMEKPFPWTDAENPVIAVGRLKGGLAVLVNLAPYPNDDFALIVSSVEVIAESGEDRMSDNIRGWFKPNIPISDFLAEYSRLGGTHHQALVYGVSPEEIIRFGKLMGWMVAII